MANAGIFDVKSVLVLGLALLSCVAEGALRGHRIGISARRGLVDTGATVFDVTQHGAKADGTTDNVEAFMQTWVAACHSDSPAKVVVPAGTFLTGPVAFGGPCKSSGPIIFEVQGTIIASTDVSEYSSAEWFSFENINGLVITGGGTFDAQGGSVWKYNDCHSNNKCQLLPSSLHFSGVNNAVVYEINSVNSMSFHLHVHECNNLTIHNVNITAPANSPNTDGIHISSSTLVNVTNNVIGTGDDCISIGQATKDITISQVTCGPGHGISVGSLGKYKDEGDVSGIVVSNCTLSNTTNGVRIKTWAGSPPSQASSITFEDIIMNSVKNPVIIDQKYGSHSGQPSRVKISDVHFKNIRGTSTSDVAISILCSTLVPCEGVELVDIDLAYVGPGKKPFIASCLNAKAIFGGKQNPPACL